MAWDDLFQLLGLKPAPPTASAHERLGAQLTELLQAMQAVDDGDDAGARAARSRLEWRAATFSLLPVDTVAREAPEALRAEATALRASLEETLRALSLAALGDADVKPLRRDLVALRELLARIDRAHEERAERGAKRKRALLLLPTVAAALAGAWLGVDRGLRVERVVGLSPAGEFENVHGTLRPRREYREQFIREFSRYYFGHPSRFEALYYNHTQPSARRVVEHKVSLRNATRRRVRYVTAVEAEVALERGAGFPWHELTVTPRVVTRQSERDDLRTLVAVSEGVGPALDLSWTLEASGMTLARGTRGILHREAQRVMPEDDPRVGERTVRGGRIDPPLYWQLSGAPEAQGDPRYQEARGCEGFPDGWYEEITDPSRLRALTTMAHDAPWRLTLRYSGLRGRPEVLRAEGDRALTRLYFQRRAALHERAPCAPLPADRDGDPGPGDSTSMLQDLAMRFAGDRAPPQPQGVDLLQARLGIELLGAPLGARVASSVSMDGFLNPQGILAVSLHYNMPGPYRHAVTIRVDGEVVGRYRFEDLAPEFMRFSEEGPEAAVARLRRVFGAQR